MKDSGTMNGGNFLDQYSDTSKVPSYFSQRLLFICISANSGIVSLQERSVLRCKGHNALRRLNTGGSLTSNRGRAHKLSEKEQNEPQSVNPTLPSARVSASSQAKIGVKLRALLDADGFKSVKVIGYEHNWDGATAYASDLVRLRNEIPVSNIDYNTSCAISHRCESLVLWMHLQVLHSIVMAEMSPSRIASIRPSRLRNCTSRSARESRGRIGGAISK